MLKHINIKISGRVQGVFYRATACTKAVELGIKGFARNEKDGSVYIEAEGEEENLAGFIDWCHIGPPRAKVEKLITEEGILKGFKEFGIEY